LLGLLILVVVLLWSWRCCPKHAEKLMKYQNKRGGRNVLQDIQVSLNLNQS